MASLSLRKLQDFYGGKIERTLSIDSLSLPKRLSKRSHYCKIQDKDEDFYREFAIIICGLDSIEARRWINATLVNMVDPEDPDTLKPLIDGGTEGKRYFGFGFAKIRLLRELNARCSGRLRLTT